MTAADETEMHRLCTMRHSIDRRLDMVSHGVAGAGDQFRRGLRVME